jgi:solute carrier family 25 aspartate/glutamate transporter 12/13
VQLIGIIPEKALKLSVNDYLRYQLRNRDGSIDLLWEAAAGGGAGFSQVIITSPMEMFKIRMQLQNKKPEHLRLPVGAVMRTTFGGGLSAVYRGAAATLSRDVPFSVLYFPMFSNLKLYFATLPSTGWSSVFRRPDSDNVKDGNQRVNLLGTFVAGLVAGSASAYAVTPADVIKTRLQSEGGVEKYKNIRQCVRMTWAEGGVRPFFKGATGRLILIGPLCGVVLVTYEFMPRVLPL